MGKHYPHPTPFPQATAEGRLNAELARRESRRGLGDMLENLTPLELRELVGLCGGERAAVSVEQAEMYVDMLGRRVNKHFELGGVRETMRRLAADDGRVRVCELQRVPHWARLDQPNRTIPSPGAGLPKPRLKGGSHWGKLGGRA